MVKNKKWCVYKHTNKINQKVYIGITSQNPKYRWANGEGYKGQGFYYAIKKYGWNNFTHEILEKNLTQEKACEREKYYIDLYNSKNSSYGYNRTNGGENARIGSDNFRARKILQCELNGDIIREWDCITDAANHLKIAKTTINNCLSKEKNSAGGYLWFYIEDIDKIEPYVAYQNQNKKQIVQYDLNGDFVREWDSITEAENYYNNSGIASCLKNNCWTSNGYLWFYKGDENIVDIKEYVKKIKHKNFRVKSVIQCSIDGEIIKIWDSITDASKKLNISASSISQCASGKRANRLACGYLWFYNKDEIHPYIKLVKKRKGIKQNKQKIQINQYDLDGNFIKTWDSLTDASNYLNGNTGHIAKCCKRKIPIYKGYQWRYKNDCDDISKYVFVGTSKKINKYSLDGEFIEMYDSCTIASQQNNISMGSISGCCNKHHKTAGGYIWRYADETSDIKLA